MPFKIIRDDITKVTADAIVNTANPFPTYAGATDKSIYEAAGAAELLEERKKIGIIMPGEAAVTGAYKLSAQYIIHTVGPDWNGGSHGEMEVLASCIRKSLILASEHECESIAFPLIATGCYSFPKDIAIRIFTNVIYGFLMQSEMEVILVVYDQESLNISEKLFGQIEDHLSSEKDRIKNLKIKLQEAEMPFHDYLIDLMIRSNLTNPEIYHRANISKQHFSKIISNADYSPSKNTICALAIAMGLSLEESEILLNKAGYVLSDSVPLDIAIRYFIKNQMYNIIEDNIILYDNGLEQLGTITL